MQHDLAIRLERTDERVTTLHLTGVIDAHTLDVFETSLAGAIDQGATSLLLDCDELRYVNSSGFGELIRYSDRLRDKGGTLVIARVAPKVEIILEMLGLKSLIPITTTLDDGIEVARKGPPAVDGETAEPPAPPPAPVLRTHPRPLAAAAPKNRITRSAPVLAADARTIVCVFCDTRLRTGGAGRWACPSCGAPFATTREGGIAFDWSRADADAVHLTFDVTPRSLAAFAGLVEGVLVERRVSHARMRRFAREAAHVCHLLSEHAFPAERRGPLHVLALAGPQRLHLRIVDRGASLEDQSAALFSTQARLFLDFRYGTLSHGVNLTEFAFAYAGSGVFVA